MAAGCIPRLLADRPLEVIADAVRNSGAQLISLDLVDFNYSEGNRERFQKTMPPTLLASMKDTRAYKGHMPVRFVEISTALLSILSCLFLVLFLVGARRTESKQEVRAYCLAVLVAIAINAAICGALSGPKGRYESRLIWVLPIIAAAMAGTTKGSEWFAQTRSSRPE